MKLHEEIIMLSMLLFLTLGIHDVEAAPKKSLEQTEEKAEKAEKAEKLEKKSSKVKKGKKAKNPASKKITKKSVSETKGSQKKSEHSRAGSEDKNLPTPAQSKLKKPLPQKGSSNKQDSNFGVERQNTPTPAQSKLKKPDSQRRAPSKGTEASPQKNASQKSETVENKPLQSNKSSQPSKKSTPKTSKKTDRPLLKSNKSSQPSKKTAPTKSPQKDSAKLQTEKLATIPGVFHQRPEFSEPNQVVDSFKRAVNPQKRRGINRRGMTSFGVQGLNYGSGYADGQTYLDPGLGLAIGTRVFNAVAFELSYAAFSEQLLPDSPERLNRPLQGVGQLYLMPRQKLSPFLSAGIVANAIDIQDQYLWNGKQKNADQESLLLGGVLGGGLEYNINKNLGFKAEGRYLNYQNTIESQPAIEDALQLSAGISIYF